LNSSPAVTDPNAITVWLALIAVASLLQVALLFGTAIAGLVVYRRASLALDALQRQTLDPVVQRVTTVLEDVHDVAGRVRAADDQVRGAMSRTAGRMGKATWILGAKLWPVVGVARGLWAVVDALNDRHSTRPTPPRGPRAVRPA
jgi:hypothetical protein